MGPLFTPKTLEGVLPAGQTSKKQVENVDMKMRTWAIPAVSLKPTLLLATVLVLLYLLCGSAHAVTLYLDQGGRLSTKLPVNATTYYVSDRNNLEWAYQVSGDISGTRDRKSVV